MHLSEIKSRTKRGRKDMLNVNGAMLGAGEQVDLELEDRELEEDGRQVRLAELLEGHNVVTDEGDVLPGAWE